MKKRTLSILLLVVALVAGGGYAAKAYFFAEAPLGYATVAAKRGDVREAVLATGQLKPSKLVAVGAQVSGRILKLHVDLGQEVKQGDLIAEIDSVKQVNDLRTSEAALANVRAQRVEKQATLVQAERTLARQKQMVARKAVSMADYEAAEADVATTRAQISALEAQIIEAQVAVETAKANLGYTKITAPMDGTVLAVVSQEGQTVNAAQSAPTIVVLGQLDIMTVRVEISEADVVNVRPGQRVFFSVLGDPDTVYNTVLKSIEPAPESITKDSSIASSASSSSSSSTSSSAIYYIGVFEIANEKRRLRTYMTAEVNIVISEATGVLTIPSSALGRRDPRGGYTVNVLAADGTVARRKIEVGLNDRVFSEVVSGLEEGERIVTGSEDPDREKRIPRSARSIGL